MSATDHMSDAECGQIAAFFSIFSNPTRLRIFCTLQDGPKTVSELAESAGVTLANMSQHLRVMRDKGALTMDRQGQHVRYSIVDERFFQAARLVRDAVDDQWRRMAKAAARRPRRR